jgi:hypothetical protein
MKNLENLIASRKAVDHECFGPNIALVLQVHSNRLGPEIRDVSLEGGALCLVFTTCFVTTWYHI